MKHPDTVQLYGRTYAKTKTALVATLFRKQGTPESYSATVEGAKQLAAGLYRAKVTA